MWLREFSIVVRSFHESLVSAQKVWRVGIDKPLYRWHNESSHTEIPGEGATNSARQYTSGTISRNLCMTALLVLKTWFGESGAVIDFSPWVRYLFLKYILIYLGSFNRILILCVPRLLWTVGFYSGAECLGGKRRRSLSAKENAVRLETRWKYRNVILKSFPLDSPLSRPYMYQFLFDVWMLGGFATYSQEIAHFVEGKKAQTPRGRGERCGDTFFVLSCT